jgi:UDP-N-acetylmuramoyl-tripeptide--D-alanyl-D-alanine ligase
MEGRRRRAIAIGLAVALAAVLFAGCHDLRRGEDGDFRAQVRAYLGDAKWKKHAEPLRLEREAAEASLSLARTFLLANQKPTGNFNYEYDFVAKKFNEDDNQVRQAGALWSLALIHLSAPDDGLRAGIEKGLAFFAASSVDGPTPGTRVIAYGKDANTSTGTVALAGLTIVDYLRSNPPIDAARRAALEAQLDGYLKLLAWLQLPDGHFASKYRLASKTKNKGSSPYYDGETLLCLTKAAKYLGRADLRPVVEKAAPVLARDYTVGAWGKEKEDSDKTKQFYQWGSMAFWEYQDAGWKDADLLGDVLLLLAHWQVRTHKVVGRMRNTGYAIEGLAHAYALAEKRGDQAATAELRYAIDTILRRLITWQVGGPLASECAFLVSHPTTDPLAVGGFMNAKDAAPLRIDVTQHTAHAIILALKYVYPGKPPAPATTPGT